VTFRGATPVVASLTPSRWDRFPRLMSNVGWLDTYGLPLHHQRVDLRFDLREG
jgi:hypothetical protein